MMYESHSIRKETNNASLIYGQPLNLITIENVGWRSCQNCSEAVLLLLNVCLPFQMSFKWRIVFKIAPTRNKKMALDVCSLKEQNHLPRMLKPYGKSLYELC